MSEGRTFQIPETVPIHTEVKDWEGNYVTPTSVKLTVYNPSDAKVVDDQDMVVLATGQYVYYYTPATNDATGWYKVKAVVVDGTGGGAKTTIQYGGFKLQ